MSLIATNNPGEFDIPELGKRINLTEWEEGDVYDTVAIPASQFQGGRMDFFTNIAGKSAIDTNMRTPGKLPARHELIVIKVGIYTCPIWGTATVPLSDIAAFWHEGVFELRKDAKVQIQQGHMLRFMSGYGLVAYGLNPADAVNIAPHSLGVASPAAIPPLLVPFVVNTLDDFDANIQFPASGAAIAFNGIPAVGFTSHTTTDEMAVKVFLHGFLKSPATR